MKLRGKHYSEFTTTHVLRGIYHARVFYYDEITRTISETPKIKSLNPKITYLLRPYPFTPSSPLSHFFLNPKLQLNP